MVPRIIGLTTNPKILPIPIQNLLRGRRMFATVNPIIRKRSDKIKNSAPKLGLTKRHSKAKMKKIAEKKRPNFLLLGSVGDILFMTDKIVLKLNKVKARFIS